jgi:SAM-dependent methyltransferase
MRILDAGSGYGRNLVHLLREGSEVFAVDLIPEAIEHVRKLSASFGTGLPAENFQVAPVEQMPFSDACMDAVLCSAVLHFARDEDQFRAMLTELWRVLRPGGLLFCRLASRIGMDFPRLEGGLFRCPTASNGSSSMKTCSWISPTNSTPSLSTPSRPPSSRTTVA